MAEKLAEKSDSGEDKFEERAIEIVRRLKELSSESDEEEPDSDDPLPLTREDTKLILSRFGKIFKATTLVIDGESKATDEEVAKNSDRIAETLRNPETLIPEDSTKQRNSENLFRVLISEVADESASDDCDNFVPHAESMLHAVLSAEFLLPSIEDLINKYSKFCDKKAKHLSAEEKDRCNAQLEFYRTIKKHLESKSPNDTAKGKRDKFKIILEDMSKWQQYGQPPMEVLASLSSESVFRNLPTEEAAPSNDDTFPCLTM